MTIRKILALLLLVSVTVQVNGQQLTREQYIDMYKSIAVKHMHKYRIPASITLAQGCLESGDGNSVLARRANNHFGIKCHDDWNGRTYRHDDDKRRECFRKYDNAEESYADHAKFLTGRSRYSSLFDLKITDYKGWAHGLKAAGYATNPQYAKLLIDIIEEYQLYKYDNGAAAKAEKDAIKYAKKEKSLRRKAEKAERKALKAKEKAVKAREKYNKFVGVDNLPKENGPKETSVRPVRTHTVTAGETLYSISRKYGKTVDDIRKLNPGVKANELKIGTELRIDQL